MIFYEKFCKEQAKINVENLEGYEEVTEHVSSSSKRFALLSDCDDFPLACHSSQNYSLFEKQKERNNMCHECFNSSVKLFSI